MVSSRCRWLQFQLFLLAWDIYPAAPGQGKDLGVGIQQTVTDNQDFLLRCIVFPSWWRSVWRRT